MWSGESQKNCHDSPPFKDFNIFDTLEPEKVETFGTDNVTTGFLIDVTDTDNQKDTKLLGSLLDAKKNEYTLVDLLENLYVTPQHVVSKNSDLELLFDDTKNNIGTSDTSIDNVGKETDSHHVPNDDLLNEKVRSFDEIFDSAVSSRYPKLNYLKTVMPSEDSVDSIPREPSMYNTPVQTQNIGIYDEAIAINSEHYMTKHNETPNNAFINIAIDSNSIFTKEKAPIENPQTDSYKPIKVLEPPNVLNIDQHKKNSNLAHEATIENRVTHFKDPLFNDISYTHLQSLIQNENERPKSVNLFESDPFTRYRKIIESSLIDLNKPPIALIKNTQPIPVLQTVKKDTKAFNKRRVIKKDSEKIRYTKGPDIYEKSVVLPQIVQRLGERKKALDAEKNLKKKLVLDKREIKEHLGAIKKVVPKLSPEVLMEDCNRERLKALKLRTDFERFVMSGQN